MTMVQKRITCTLALAFWLAGPSPASAEPRFEHQARPVIMIVHGAWGGGWAFRETEQRLRGLGYDVYRPTLTGLGERAHLATDGVGLGTHIDDIAGVLRFENLHEVILVGHSYGGFVVTGVADREPDRIRRLVYLDAYIPKDGDSWQKLSGENPDRLDAMIQGHGLVPPWVEAGQPYPRDVPHPLRAYTEPIQLDGQAGAGLPVSYILTVEDLRHPENDEFSHFAELARERGWPVHLLESDHNPQWSAVGPLVELLDEIVGND